MSKYFRVDVTKALIDIPKVGSIEFSSGGKVESTRFNSEELTILFPLEHAGFELRCDEVDEKLLAAGDICLISSKFSYSLEWCNAHYLKVSVKNDFIKKAISGDKSDLISALSTRIGFHDSFALRYAQICREYINKHGSDDIEYYQSWIHILLNYLIEHYAVIEQPTSQHYQPTHDIDKIPDKNIRELMIYMDLNVDTTMTVKEMADYVGMSQYHFIRVFKAVVGMPPARYFGLQKINKAKHLLLEGNSISDVAFKLGYSSQAHFSNAFTAVEGVAPGKFLKEKFN
ncbi:helix-turn-helix domain-containing protein [Kangiella sp. M94]